MRKIYLLLAFFGFCTNIVFARKGPEAERNTTSKETTTYLRANCQPGVSEIDQQINNVRARLTTGGDVWWNKDDGLYIVPKPAEGQLPVSAIFAGGVWVGGVDRSGNVKLAGVTYRSLTSSFDWYPGPLDEAGATEADDCRNWDRFFTVLATEVAAHNTAFELSRSNNVAYDCDSIPENVKYWPGKGNPYWREKYNFELPNQTLGAFWDENEDGIYDPCDGDFPSIEIRDCGPENRNKAKELVPDEMIFWIYNDNGGPHRLTSGSAIQMEVQVQAFAYSTNDEINDMTFQRYKLINKANEDLVDCYFAMWVDPDLGCYTDDYIGCDVGRSLAYVYNEDAQDGQNGTTCPGGVNTYGTRIPALGVDYFRGPRGPKVFVRDERTGAILKDQNGNTLLRDPIPQSGEIDTLVELGMTSFIYTNNAGVNSPPAATTDPVGQDIQFYNNIRGLWKTGEAITFGGSGYNPGSRDSVRYVFPDAPDRNNGWSMCTASLPNGDRRTLQSTGPLLLQPSATNELIIGVVFVPDIDYPCPDISRLENADDIAQSLFNNCFDITDGPDAPDICGVELDKEIILALSNDRASSNNALLAYEEVDLKAPETVDDNLYRFEGYKIFQLADAGVTPQELGDISKARLIYQTDISNGVAEIFNWRSEPNPLPGSNNEPVWSFTRMVQGNNKGIQNTYRVVEDQFATGDRSLINQKPYHFMVLAYAYNNFENFDPKTVLGQRTPYLEGRRNVKVYSFTPRPIVYTKLNSEYGDGAQVVRLTGQGSGTQFLELEEGESARLIQNNDGKVKYKNGAGPITVKVFNPFEIVDGKYKLEVIGEFDNSLANCGLRPGAKWQLTEVNTGEVVASETTIEKINEQVIYKKGFSIELAQTKEPGTQPGDGNGAIGQQFKYKDNTKQWYNAMVSGSNLGAPLLPQTVFEPVELVSSLDPNKELSKMGPGFFFPFATARYLTPPADQFPFYLSPAWRDGGGQGLLLNNRLGSLFIKDLNNVDIVFTSNKDLWSRCIVVETSSPDYYTTIGAATKEGSKMLEVRPAVSVDKNGNPDPSAPPGLSWFPGYAIDVETGERLNIFFGENSSFSGANGIYMDNPTAASDMIFNPTGQIFSTINGQLPMQIPLGGQHYIYVTRQKYDGCEKLRTALAKGTLLTRKIDPLSLVTWTSVAVGATSVPMLSMQNGLVPSDLTISLRVNNPFSKRRIIEEITQIKRCDVGAELPSYEFEFTGKAVADLGQEEYEGALANVRAVPNPYYAYSAYETNQFSNTIKITNLPERAIVTIYSLDGKFIRSFNREERPGVKAGSNPANGNSQIRPSLEWDMKNAVGIPVSSGVYLIHIAAPELGEERTIKWFGVNRKFDPTGL